MRRIRDRVAAIRVWLDAEVTMTRAGVAWIMMGFVVLAGASIVGVLKVESLSDQQLRDVGIALDAVRHEAAVREYQACAQAVEGRLALRETMIDLYVGVAALGGETADLFAEQQRRLLDERRPPLSLADCPEPPQPRIHDNGDD